MKEGEKPGKFLLPHGIILLKFGPGTIHISGQHGKREESRM
jgi:hypothetical protein